MRMIRKKRRRRCGTEKSSNGGGDDDDFFGKLKFRHKLSREKEHGRDDQKHLKIV